MPSDPASSGSTLKGLPTRVLVDMSSDQPGEPGVRRTTDPAVVRSVVEARGGYPAHEPRTEGQGDQGLLQIGRHGREEELKEISWDAFAEEFREKDLEFVYPDDATDDVPGAGESAPIDSDVGGTGEVDPVGELRKRSGR